jgi:ribonucleoside-diphosphate reductase alpha chain
MENISAFPNVRQLSPTAKQILNKRYMWEGEKTWDDLVNRVMNYIIPKDDKDFEIIKEMIMHRYFMPNSPCLANAGKEGAGLCACYVVDFKDTIEEIYKTKYDFALVARKGGGCGTTLSKLRPRGADVKGSTHGYAGGPVAFADTISRDMSVITQGGLRAMAIMFTMSVYHPDILEFIDAKDHEGKIANANMSVVVDSAFMQAVKEDKAYWTEFNGKKYKEYKAREVFDKIVEGAWRNGEPGLLFSDRMNDSPYKHTGQYIMATNPCAEQPLPPSGVCNLGSIDLSKFVSKQQKVTDYEKLKLTTKLAIKFLDNVVDMSSYPTPEIEKWALQNRAIGVGIMGFADYCLMKEIAYGSEESLKELDYLTSQIYVWALEESEERGRTLGIPKECRKLPVQRRNITVTTIAPTGTVSLIAGASSGIEPVFSEIVIRNDKTGTYVFETDLANKPYFRCAVSTNGAEHEVTWEEHVKVLATAQKNIDSGVSKTINFPTMTHRDTIGKAMIMAWELGCKGIAVYRNQSRKEEVLSPKNISQNKCPLCGKDIVEENDRKRCIDQEVCKWNLKE